MEVLAIEVIKDRHHLLFYGRQTAGTLRRGSAEFDRFLAVIELALQRVP